MKVFVTGLFSLNQDIPAFKEHLRDFLVQIKVRLLLTAVLPATQPIPEGQQEVTEGFLAASLVHSFTTTPWSRL